jgi:hypothetical protein
MSVSLREKVAEIVNSVSISGFIAGRDNRPLQQEFIDNKIDELCSLFPPQLTEGEVEKILPKKIDIIDHHEKYYKDCHRCIEILAINQTIDDCKSALIGKCATPTFSGEKEKETKIFDLDIKTIEIVDWLKLHHNHKLIISDCFIQCEKCKEIFMYKIPTEQKEYGGPGNSGNFGPIPAEKKEEKRFGDICNNCGCEKILHNCPECGMKQPEPKPKDRIEELENVIDKELLKVAIPLELSSEEVTTLAKGLTKAIADMVIRYINKES